jgi:hypothetical protein
MGNTLSNLFNAIILFYRTIRNKLLYKTDKRDCQEEKKEDTSIIVRNEYKFIKNQEEYEYLQQDSQIEEISNAIKDVNIEFDNDETKKKVDDNLDDLKMQILSEQEDNEN